MHLRFSLVTVALGAVAFGAGCGGDGASNAAKPNGAAFLTVMHSPIAAGDAVRSDGELLALGNQVCADLDAGLRSDAVVEHLQPGALPGSAEYNAGSMLAAGAAKFLCPRHAADFSGGGALPVGN